jgi:hypothetical protein
MTAIAAVDADMRRMTRASPISGRVLRVYGVLGNHDSITMVPDLEAMGIAVLLNESIAIGRGEDAIYLAGVDDAHFCRADNIEKAATEIPERCVSFLLEADVPRAKILPRPTADAQGPGNRSARSPSSCALTARATLLSEARDIGAEVPGFVAAKLHIGHPWMWIHQELRDLFRVEPGHPGNGSKGRRIVRPSRLIVGDDVAGRAPTPCQPFAVRHIGGQCLSARCPNADAKSKGAQRSENRIGSTPKKVSHAAAPRRRVSVCAKKTRLATVG